MRTRLDGELRIVLSVLSACLIFFVTACDNSDVAGNSAGGEQVEEVATSDFARPPSATSSETAESEVESVSSGQAVDGQPVQSDRIDIPSFSGILSQLNSYEYELEISFSGHSIDGHAASWELANRYVSNKDVAGFYSNLRYEGDGSLLEPDSVTVAELNDVSYLFLPNVGCIVNSSDSLAAPIEGAPFLDRVIGPILNASGTGEWTEINDREVHRYLFDVESLPEWPQEDVDVSGEIFMAEGGIPVRVTLLANGQRDYLDQNIVQTGEFAMSLDFLNINSGPAIELPLSCTVEPEYPILADAYDLTLLEGLITYKSRVSLDAAMSFYQDEMAVAGWVADIPLVIEGSALLSFSSGDRQVTVNIDQDGENEPVVIVISQ